MAMEKALVPLSFVYAWNLESLSFSRRASKEAWHHSSSFMAGGYRWRLTLHPTCHEEEGGKSYWSLFLMPEDDTVLPPHFIVETILETSLFNEKNKLNKKAGRYSWIPRESMKVVIFLCTWSWTTPKNSPLLTKCLQILSSLWWIRSTETTMNAEEKSPAGTTAVHQGLDCYQFMDFTRAET
ncbi:hypothetical protein Taro_040344 [Colocasia esculenta]|uniref:MATH domain-containing protein n=1 Tax=Colocasia esculenta TaxID=4460 RepID=A0A843WSR3_COLES|nr:hypothetical protein [Colocasia esculenta]